MDAQSAEFLETIEPAHNVDDYVPEAQGVYTDQACLAEVGYWDRTRNFLARHKGKMALGAVAASATLTLALNPYEEVKEKVVETAPAVGVGLATSEALFVGGLGMMASAVGGKVGNPLKLKERMPEICEKANDSALFKVGFWTNAVGAVGSATVISAGVIAKLPPESYGILSVAAADIAVTVAVRKAMLSGIKDTIANK